MQSLRRVTSSKQRQRQLIVPWVSSARCIETSLRLSLFERGRSLGNAVQRIEGRASASESLLVARFGKQLIGRARNLFDQQLWFWGQDIARLGGDGLVRFGFQRHAPPAGIQTSSCYTLSCSSRRIGLWGFGAFFGEPGKGGLFLKRYTFGPCISQHNDKTPRCWALDQWGEYHVPADEKDWQRSIELLTEFIRWIMEYEMWVEEFAPEQHRAECLRDWKKRCCGPKQIIQEWDLIRSSLLSDSGPEMLLTAA